MLSTWIYPATAGSVTLARKDARRRVEHTSLADTVELVVSELATNALRHGSCEGGEIELSLELGEVGVMVRVWDQGADLWDGSVGGSVGDVESGRGLEIVSALASKLGHDVQGDGQTVWALLAWEE